MTALLGCIDCIERFYAVVFMDLTIILIPCGNCVLALSVMPVLSPSVPECPFVLCEAMNILRLVVRVSRTVVADMLLFVFRTSMELFGPTLVVLNSSEQVAS